MKRFFGFIFLWMMVWNVGWGQVCNGNIILSSQAEVDAFNCSEINGNLNINGLDVTNLNGLSELTKINGFFSIGSTSLTNLQGMENIITITEGISFFNNENLLNFSGLENLTITDFVSVSTNESLSSFSGLENLTTITGSVGIYNNESLLNFSELENLTTIEGFVEIQNNNSLINFSGLENLTSIGDGVIISANPSLVSLEGLESLTSTGGNIFGIVQNPLLVNLEGLESLTSYGDAFYIQENDGLINLNGLQGLTEIKDVLTIVNNPSLSSLIGLDNITKIDTLGLIEITENESLLNLTGLGGLNEISDGGYLVIENNSSLINLQGLENLNALNGNFWITDNGNLENLLGLENFLTITESGALFIDADSSLTTINGLQNLSTLEGTLLISDNPLLTNINALQNLTDETGELIFTRNEALTDIQGLANLNSIGLLSFWQTGISNLQGLNNLNEVTDRIRFFDNDNLIDFQGLENLTFVNVVFTVHDNQNLESFNGLQNLENVGGFNVRRNPSLSNINDLQIQNLTYQGGFIFFDENENLENFAGFSNVDSLNSLTINNHPLINNLSSFQNLEYLNILRLENNDSLNNISQLTNLSNSKINTISILGNPQLSNLIGLNNIDTIENLLTLESNTILSALNGLENLNYIGGVLSIISNDSLSNLTALLNLSIVSDEINIENNNELTSLIGLDNVNPDSISNLTILSSNNLSFCNVPSICDYLANGGVAAISDNASGCNDTDEVQSACGLITDDCNEENGLFSFFKFENTPNDIVNGIQGTANGATLTDDRFGNANSAYNFDGNDYLDYEDELDLGTSEFAISFWFNASSFSSGTNGTKLINKGLTSSGTPSNAGYGFRVRNTSLGNRLRFQAGNGTFATAEVFGLETNTWNHVIGQREGDSLFLYLNGSLVDTKFIDPSTNVNTNIPLAFGALHRGSFGSTSEYFNGKIDDLRFYVDRTFTDVEVQDLYDCEKGTVPPPCTVIGTTTFTSQAQINAFPQTCHIIDGNLIISGADITDLSPLSSIIQVTGEVFLQNNPLLIDLGGLEGLTSIGGCLHILGNDLLQNINALINITIIGTDIFIENNPVLININGLGGLTIINGGFRLVNLPLLNNIDGVSGVLEITLQVFIDNCPSLINIFGFQNITFIGGNIQISNCILITDLSGFSSLTIIGGSIRIEGNGGIVNLQGLNGVISIGGDFYIIDVPDLSSLDVLITLEFIGGCFHLTDLDNLTTLDGLDNLLDIGTDLVITDNDILSDFCAILKLYETNGVLGNITVTGNQINPIIAADLSSCVITPGNDPDITCPADITIEIPINEIQTPVSWPLPTITTSCPYGYSDGVNGPGNGGIYPLGITEVSQWVYDGCDGYTNCTFTITVINSIVSPPGDLTVECLDYFTWEAEIGATTANVTWDDPAVSSSCGGIELVQTGGLPKGSAFPMGWTCILYEIEDDCNDMQQCHFCFEVVENGTLIVNNNTNTLFAIPQILQLESTITNGDQVQLDWYTNKDFNHAPFVVERSVNGGQFLTVETVANLNSNAPLASFNLIDEAPHKGENFYRIRIPNTQGNDYYSNVIMEKITEVDRLLVYPNPAQEKVYLNLDAFEGEKCNIQLTNQLGQVMFQMETLAQPNQPFEIDLKDWKNGIYYIFVKAEHQRLISRKLVVTKLD